jgi:hypothetical protein
VAGLVVPVAVAAGVVAVAGFVLRLMFVIVVPDVAGIEVPVAAGVVAVAGFVLRLMLVIVVPDVAGIEVPVAAGVVVVGGFVLRILMLVIVVPDVAGLLVLVATPVTEKHQNPRFSFSLGVLDCNGCKTLVILYCIRCWPK